MPDIKALLSKAGVPAAFHPSAIASLTLAKDRSSGLLWNKIDARLFKANKIAELLQWENNRLIEVKPEWADYDIAPMLNITSNGDNAPWIDYSTPNENAYLDKSPESEDYLNAVVSCYWFKGHHPRSQLARRAWYRRNGGEFAAYNRGVPVNIKAPLNFWENNGLYVFQLEDVWLIKGKRHIIGSLAWEFKYGFEIDNIKGITQEQRWYPIPGYELKAPAVWSSHPSLKG